MKNKFLLKYIDFARALDKEDKKHNYIKGIISSDYSEKKLEKEIDKQNDFFNSVNELLVFANSIKGLSGKEKDELDARLKAIHKKESSFVKGKEFLHNGLCHYAALLKSSSISFIIIFRNNDYWCVDFTASLRVDRLETHMHRFSNTGASRNFIVTCSYPYHDDNSKNLINAKKRSMSFSNIKIVCLEEFMDELLYNIFSYTTNSKGKYGPITGNFALSSINGSRGTAFEKLFTEVISNQKNFSLLTSEDEKKNETITGSFFPNEYAIIVKKILKDNSVKPEDVKKISAKDVGGTKEKGDISVTITLNDESTIVKNISLKCSSAELIAVHEKPAEEFIDYFDIKDEKVKAALRNFEKLGSNKELEEDEQKALLNFFSEPKNSDKLNEWAIIGSVSDKYKADYILMHSYKFTEFECKNELAIKIMSSAEYIDEIKSHTLSYGTNFSWTRKKYIQLKAAFPLNKS